MSAAVVIVLQQQRGKIITLSLNKNRQFRFFTKFYKTTADSLVEIQLSLVYCGGYVLKMQVVNYLFYVLRL